MLLKALSITSAFVLILITFFGVNGLFNPVIMLSISVPFLCLCILLAKLIFSLFSILKRKPHDNVYVLFSIILFICLSLFFQKEVHIYGLKFIVKNNIETLNKAAAKILSTSKEDKLQWNSEFDLWPAFIGPTRESAWHNSGVLYLDFEGAPGSIVGLCYNPSHVALSGCKESISGDWYRLDADIE